MGGQRHVPAALRPEMILYPFERRLGGPQGRSGWERKISPPIAIRTPDRRIRSNIPITLSRPANHNYLFSGYAGILNDQMGTVGRQKRYELKRQVEN